MRLRLTQAQFAAKLGVIGISIARYEGGRVPRADILDRIARLGGTTSAWILHGDQRPTTRAVPRRSVPNALPRHIRQLITLLSPDWTADPWNRASPDVRRRYERRVRENAVQLKRHLEEYRRLLFAISSRSGRTATPGKLSKSWSSPMIPRLPQ